MLTQDKARELIDIALKHGMRKKVDGIEAIISASNIATSRFANNGMTQNQSPEHISISVRVQLKGKQARLSTDKITAAGIRELVENAIISASFLEPEEDMLPLPQPQKRAEQKSAARFDARTAGFTAEQRAKGIAQMVAVAKERGLEAAGIFATGTWVQAIGNSQGLFRYHRETSAEVSVTMKHSEPAGGGESTGWAKANSPRVGDIDCSALAARAAQKAVASANPQEIEPGRYTVILEPSAVLDLVCFIWHDLTATSFLDKLSCFLDKQGKPVVGPNITITDDAFHPLQAGAPFDGEGLQRSVVSLIKNGVLEHLVYGRKSARDMHAQPTGHGVVEPSAEGESPDNLVVAGGNSSLEEMIRSTKRGVLLTRVWYVREVDPTTKIVTGMTRDGTFLIEDGAIKSGIKNMRFNESIVEMLSNVEMLGPAVRAAGEEGEPAVVPAMKVRDFHFSSVTRF